MWMLTGFHTEGGGGGGSGSSLPEILQLRMVIIVVPSILAITGHKYVICPRLCHKQSARI